MSEVPREDDAERAHTFYGAVLALLAVQAMRASAIGRVLYYGEPNATSRTRGGLLAMRRLGWVDANVDDDASYWRITRDGRAWLKAKLLGHVNEASDARG